MCSTLLSAVNKYYKYFTEIEPKVKNIFSVPAVSNSTSPKAALVTYCVLVGTTSALHCRK